jgi:hypothetical protein
MVVVATVIPTAVTLPVEAEAVDMAHTAVVLLVAPTAAARVPMVPAELVVIRCPTWAPV